MVLVQDYSTSVVRWDMVRTTACTVRSVSQAAEGQGTRATLTAVPVAVPSQLWRVDSAVVAMV